MATVQVIEKSISVKYSEIDYIILRVSYENTIKKWLMLVKNWTQFMYGPRSIQKKLQLRYFC